ncbi:MAG TPA: metalloregulator ArsR/SmtB family transcription factor [Pseudogracilibacillus sp.]|nr:metalloregulator ArsR/SmtB family transcription factor [Pseudogracilibacillus sp.]
MTKEDLTMLDEHIEQDIAQLFKAFSNPTRIKIIFVLKNKPLTVSQICRALNMSQSAISHQLRELKMARLVTFKKQGRETLYQLDDKHVHDIFDLAIEHVKEIYHYD